MLWCEHYIEELFDLFMSCFPRTMQFNVFTNNNNKRNTNESISKSKTTAFFEQSTGELLFVYKWRIHISSFFRNKFSAKWESEQNRNVTFTYWKRLVQFEWNSLTRRSWISAKYHICFCKVFDLKIDIFRRIFQIKSDWSK